MQRIAVACLALTLVALVSRAEEQPAVSGLADATITHETGGPLLRTRSRSFSPAQYVDRGRVRTVLVEGEVTRRLRVTDDLGAAANPAGSVTLTIRPITKGGRFGTPSATRTLVGDAIEVTSPAGVTVTSFGCCQQDDALALLSLASLETLYVRSAGAPLTTYTRLGPPAVGRVIAVYRAMTPSDDAVLGSDPSAIGLVTLAGEDRVLQRIVVHLRATTPREAALEWGTEVGWRGAAGGLDSHVVVDPAHPSEPVWEWRIGAGRAIVLPLVDDRLDVGRATLPADVTLGPAADGVGMP